MTSKLRKHDTLYYGYQYPFNQCCGSGMFIPDPNFSIPGPGSRIKKIPDPGSGSASKNLSIFSPKNCFKLSKIWSGMFIPDSDLDLYPSRIADPGVKKAPNPVSGSAILHLTQAIQVRIHLCSWIRILFQKVIKTEIEQKKCKKRTKTELHKSKKYVGNIFTISIAHLSPRSRSISLVRAPDMRGQEATELKFLNFSLTTWPLAVISATRASRLRAQ